RRVSHRPIELVDAEVVGAGGVSTHQDLYGLELKGVRVEELDATQGSEIVVRLVGGQGRIVDDRGGRRRRRSEQRHQATEAKRRAHIPSRRVRAFYAAVSAGG